MRLKICGLSREEDISYVNETSPDYIGFVFAPSRRFVSPAAAAVLKKRLTAGIETAGVFVNAPIGAPAALYREKVISMVQLHGNEDAAYIARLKEESASAAPQVPVIKVLFGAKLEETILNKPESIPPNADYYLIDSGSGSGETFDWSVLEPGGVCASWLASSGKPWFIAGGVSALNIQEAMSLHPFGIDVSGGAETNGVKDREKIARLVSIVKGAQQGNQL